MNPEYETDGGTIDLWKYFTQTKKYFDVKDLRAWDENQIESKISSEMEKVRVHGKDFPPQFIRGYSDKAATVGEIKTEIREASAIQTEHKKDKKTILAMRKPSGQFITTYTLKPKEKLKDGLGQLRQRFKTKLQKLD